MKIFKILFISFLLSYSSLLAQEPDQKQQPDQNQQVVQFGFGIGIGIFYPEDVSNYILSDLTRKHHAISTFNTEMYMNIVGSISLTFNISRMFNLVGTFEYGWAPKYITGVDDYYHFDRISPGVLGNFNIPIGKGRHSIFFGGGAFLHAMNFEDFKATAVGPRIQAGVSLRFGRLNPQVCISYDYVVGESESTVYYGDIYYTSISSKQKIS